MKILSKHIKKLKKIKSEIKSDLKKELSESECEELTFLLREIQHTIESFENS